MSHFLTGFLPVINSLASSDPVRSVTVQCPTLNLSLKCIHILDPHSEVRMGFAWMMVTTYRRYTASTRALAGIPVAYRGSYVDDLYSR